MEVLQLLFTSYRNKRTHTLFSQKNSANTDTAAFRAERRHDAQQTLTNLARATINIIYNVRHTTPYNDRLKKAAAIPHELSRHHVRQLTVSQPQPTTSPRIPRAFLA